jgi:hypothetical protein
MRTEGMGSRNVAGLLPIKLLMDNDVADVADFPTRNAFHCQEPNPAGSFCLFPQWGRGRRNEAPRQLG